MSIPEGWMIKMDQKEVNKKDGEDWKIDLDIPEGWIMKIDQKEMDKKDGEDWETDTDIPEGWIMKTDQKEPEKKRGASNPDQEITSGKKRKETEKIS